MSNVVVSEANKPFQIFRVSVPDGEHSRRADVVEKFHYDAVKAELAALRERTATMLEEHRKHRDLAIDEQDAISKLLTAAEQRNAELVELLCEAMPHLDTAASAFKAAKPVRDKVRAALKPTESGASA